MLATTGVHARTTDGRGGTSMADAPREHETARRLATLESHLVRHIHLAKSYRAEFGPAAGLLKKNATALRGTMRRFEGLRGDGGEVQRGTTVPDAVGGGKGGGGARGGGGCGGLLPPRTGSG